MQRRRSQQWIGIVVAVVAVVAGLVGACSGSDADVTSAPGSVEVSTTRVQGELFTPVSSPRESDIAETIEPGAPVESIAPGESIAPVESLPAVPESGIPGIDSDDDFCRAWSEYAGSVQALSLAWSLQSPDAAARLEAAASNALIGAIAALGAQLPPEIESNRQALTVDVPGPFLRRAERARQALVDAGATDDQISVLGDAWLAAIAAAGLDSADVAVEASPDVDAALAAATVFVVENLPSILEDPSLDTTAFDITPSLDYITATCPDQGTLAGNDVIGPDGI